ncbi:MAG: hypothetical protein ABFD62_09585 [Syntrophaceae bacterium]
MVQQDFRDLLALFNEKQVDYIIIGAHALSYYGSPRATGDLDIYVRPDRENAARILEALDVFGFGSLDFGIDDFVVKDNVLQLGFPPVRIDIVTSITGVTWEEASAGREEGPFGDLKVFYIGRIQFTENKRALGRKKDLADLEAIGED